MKTSPATAAPLTTVFPERFADGPSFRTIVEMTPTGGVWVPGVVPTGPLLAAQVEASIAIQQGNPWPPVHIAIGTEGAHLFVGIKRWLMKDDVRLAGIEDRLAGDRTAKQLIRLGTRATLIAADAELCNDVPIAQRAVHVALRAFDRGAALYQSEQNPFTAAWALRAATDVAWYFLGPAAAHDRSEAFCHRLLPNSWESGNSRDELLPLPAAQLDLLAMACEMHGDIETELGRVENALAAYGSAHHVTDLFLDQDPKPIGWIFPAPKIFRPFFQPHPRLSLKRDDHDRIVEKLQLIHANVRQERH